jgi:hypothetical protein
VIPNSARASFLGNVSSSGSVRHADLLAHALHEKQKGAAGEGEQRRDRKVFQHTRISISPWET